MRHKIRHIADTASCPVTERGQEAPIISEAGFRIGIHAGVEIGFALRQSLKTNAQHQHADTRDDPGQQSSVYTCHSAKCLWQRKMPAPTMDPTTIAVNTEERISVLIR